jgi:hypothetical protein
MNKIPKDKRNQLIAVTLGTLMAVVALWFLLLNVQQSRLQELSGRISDTQEKLKIMHRAVQESPKLAAELQVAAQKLSALEEDMASGDLYSWIIDTVKRFKVSHHVDIPQFGPVATGDVNLFPKFPYRQALLGVSGTAYYHDFGKFLADFENRFPSMRIQNLELEPASATSPDDKEKLSFRMEIVMLVKPTS